MDIQVIVSIFHFSMIIIDPGAGGERLEEVGFDLTGAMVNKAPGAGFPYLISLTLSNFLCKIFKV